MAEAETFLAQVTPYNENPITAIFDTRGMAAALKPLAKTCGWLETLEREAAAEFPAQPAASHPSAKQAQQTAGPRQQEAPQDRLSISEIDALLRQIGACWILPAGLDGLEDEVVRLRIHVAPDGSIRSITIVQDAKAPAVTISAVRAVEKCSPLALPRDKYDAWRDLELNLYPEYAIGG
jgi:TonB family protein